jgi:hypothetical protein
MSSVEERLAKVEREVEQLLVRQNLWPIAEIDEKFKGDPVLQEIFRLAKDERDKEEEISKE